MQVTQTHVPMGLKREFEIVLPAQDLSSQACRPSSARCRRRRASTGFRPGKVPVAHLKRLYGRSVMAEVLQEAVGQARTKMIADNNLRLAGEPHLRRRRATTTRSSARSRPEGDLTFKVALEVLPKVEVGALDDITIEKLVAEVPEEEVDRVVAVLADQNRAYEPKERRGRRRPTGDKATIDFVGKIDDEIVRRRHRRRRRPRARLETPSSPASRTQVVGMGASATTAPITVAFPEPITARRPSPARPPSSASR